MKLEIRIVSKKTESIFKVVFAERFRAPGPGSSRCPAAITARSRRTRPRGAVRPLAPEAAALARAEQAADGLAGLADRVPTVPSRPDGARRVFVTAWPVGVGSARTPHRAGDGPAGAADGAADRSVTRLAPSGRCSGRPAGRRGASGGGAGGPWPRCRRRRPPVPVPTSGRVAGATGPCAVGGRRARPTWSPGPRARAAPRPRAPPRVAGRPEGAAPHHGRGRRRPRRRCPEPGRGGDGRRRSPGVEESSRSVIPPIPPDARGQRRAR